MTRGVASAEPCGEDVAKPAMEPPSGGEAAEPAMEPPSGEGATTAEPAVEPPSGEGATAEPAMEPPSGEGATAGVGGEVALAVVALAEVPVGSPPAEPPLPFWREVAETGCTALLAVADCTAVCSAVADGFWMIGAASEGTVATGKLPAAPSRIGEMVPRRGVASQAALPKPRARGAKPTDGTVRLSALTVWMRTVLAVVSVLRMVMKQRRRRTASATTL